MEIFPLHYFRENVKVVYTKVNSGEDDGEIGDIIEERRGKFIESLTKKKDFENFKKFIKDNKIKCPSSIYEYFINSKKKLKNIDALTKSKYQKILNTIVEFPKLFEKIIHKDRDKFIETGVTLNKIKTLRKITFIPRYGENIILKEFILPPERDNIHF